MPRQSASGDPAPVRPAGRVAAPAYPPREWELLTRLPARVVVAATSVGPDAGTRPVADGLAGLDAIAAGRVFDSDLVRAVVAAIYAESEDDRPVATPAAGPAEVLASCREAVAVLAARADPADSAAYRQWVQSAAARVCSADPLGMDRAWLSPAERRFMDDLAVALRLA